MIHVEQSKNPQHCNVDGDRECSFPNSSTSEEVVSFISGYDSNSDHIKKRTDITLICEFCGRIFLDEKNFRRHHQTHVIKKTFTCDKCPKSYSSKSTLSNHMTSHAEENAHMCHTCEKSFTTKRGLAKHKKTIHVDKKQCEFCNKIFVGNDELKRHYKIHIDEQHYDCGMCDKRFTTIRDYKNHVLEHSSKFSCDVCAKKFKTKNILHEHLKLHSGVEPFKCDVCHKRFVIKKYLVNHRRIHTGEKPHLCFICKKRFLIKRYLTEHIRIHTGEKPLVCNICSQSFRHSNSLNIHRLRHTKSFRHECEICHKKFVTKKDLRSHLVIHSSERPFVCNICSKSFKLSRALKTHCLEHGDDRKHACDICQKKFFAEYNLKKHYQSHVDKKENTKLVNAKLENTKIVKLVAPHERTQEPAADEEQFDCSVSKKSYSHRTPLSRHIIRHGVKKHVCEICNKGFFTKYKLKCHQRIHSSEKFFYCDVCGKRYRYRDNLKNHVFWKHHRVSKHVCEFCEKHFFNKQKLQDHRNSHTGEKPFVCNICGTGFSSKGALRRHYLTHGEKKYSCKICDKSYYRANSLQAHHITNHTPGETVCKDCDQRFPDNLSLREHRNLLHRTYICDVCHKGFSEKNYLKTHKQVHKKKAHVCVVCGKGFIQRSILQKHLLVHIKPHACHACNKSFTCKNYLDKHYSKEHNKDNVRGTHLCNVCGKSFLLKKYLQSHLKIHLSLKPHICLYCNKGFIFKYLLAKHQRRVHKQHKFPEYDLICHICNKGFATKQARTIHQRRTHDFVEAVVSHRGKEIFLEKTSVKKNKQEKNIVKNSLKKYPCPHCKIIFTNQNFLQKHQIKEHVALRCAYCAKSFSNVKAVKVHYFKAHGNTVTVDIKQLITNISPKEYDKQLQENNANQTGTQFKRDSVSPKDTAKESEQLRDSDVCDNDSQAPQKNTVSTTKDVDTAQLYVCDVCQKKFAQKYYLKQHSQWHEAKKELSVYKKIISSISSNNECVRDTSEIVLDNNKLNSNAIPKNPDDQIHEANISQKGCDKKLEISSGFLIESSKGFEICDISLNSPENQSHQNNDFPEDSNKHIYRSHVPYNESDQQRKNNISVKDCDIHLYENNNSPTNADRNVSLNDSHDHTFESNISTSDSVKQLHMSYILLKASDMQIAGSNGSPKDYVKKSNDSNVIYNISNQLHQNNSNKKGRNKQYVTSAFLKDKQAPIKSVSFDDSKKPAHKEHDVTKNSDQQLQESNRSPTFKVKFQSRKRKQTANDQCAMKKFEKQNPHVCLVCDKMFSKETFLKKHLMVHEEKKAHVCNICDMSFSTKCSLTNHSDVHILKFRPPTSHVSYNLLEEEGEIHQMSYLCEISDKKVSGKDMLKKHYLIPKEKNHTVGKKISRNRHSFKRHVNVTLNAKVPDTALNSVENNKVASPIIIKIKNAHSP